MKMEPTKFIRKRGIFAELSRTPARLFCGAALLGATQELAHAQAPEIAVSQPSTTNIPDNGSKSFGSVSGGSNTSLVFTVKNLGAANLTLGALSIDGTNAGDFSVTANPASPVVPSGSTTFTVRFAPLAAGWRSAALHMVNNDSNENPFDINLSGTGTGTAFPLIAVEQPAGTSLSDGTGGVGFTAGGPGVAVTKTITIRNNGGVNLSGLAVAISGTDAARFATTQPAIPVLAGQTSTFTVTYTAPAAPFASGVHSANLQVTSNDVDRSPFDLVLTGTVSGNIKSYTGSPGEASAAIELANGLFLAGDNEDENLRFYSLTTASPVPQAPGAVPAVLTLNAVWNPGAPNFPLNTLPNLLNFVMTPAPDGGSNGAGGGNRVWRDGDIEGAALIGTRTYWMGSHSNSIGTGGILRPNRRRLFSLDLNAGQNGFVQNAGVMVPPLVFGAIGNNLRTALFAWDNAPGAPPVPGPHFADSFGLLNEGDTLTSEEGLDGFNIEGLSATERGTLFMGFRSPLVDPQRRLRGGVQLNRSHAIVVELTNQDAVLNGNNAVAPVFGRSFELDLGGRGIRDMRFNGNTYLILAGRVTLLNQVDDFALFTWKPGLAPVLRYANFPVGLTPEGIATFPLGDHYTPSASDAFLVKVLSDDGIGGGSRLTVGNNFRSFDAAVPAPGQMFKFDAIPPLVLHNSSLGLARRVRLSGLAGLANGDVATVTTAVTAGATPLTVVPIVVTQPGAGNEPSGALDFTPAGNIATAPGSATIKVTATLNTGGVFTRSFKVHNYSNWASFTPPGTAGATLDAVASSGLAAGSTGPNPIDWDGINTTTTPVSGSQSGYEAVNNAQGIAAGVISELVGEDNVGRLNLWPAAQGVPVSGGPVTLFAGLDNDVSYGGAYIDLNETGSLLVGWHSGGGDLLRVCRIDPLNAVTPASIQVSSFTNLGTQGAYLQWTMPGYTAQCIAADDTIAGTLGQSGVSVRNFVWEASNRAFPVMLPLEPGWVVDGVYDVMVTASGMVAGSNGTTFKKWTRGIGGVWGAPDVRALGTATFVGMTYHGQILRNASGIGVEIIDSGVTAGAWPSFAVPALPSPASNLAYGTNYCAEGYLLTSTPIIRVPVIVN